MKKYNRARSAEDRIVSTRSVLAQQSCLVVNVPCGHDNVKVSRVSRPGTLAAVFCNSDSHMQDAEPDALS